MQLKSKITLINIISILIAVCFATISFIVYFSFFLNPNIRDYYISRHELFAGFLALDSRDNLSELFETPPVDRSAVLIVDVATNKPLITYPENLISTIITVEQWRPSYLIDKLSAKWGDDSLSFYSESIVNEQQGLMMVYFSFKPKFVEKNKGPLPYILIFSGIAILVASILSMIILQRTGSNIKHLERATRRIADGDLDSEVNLKGGDEVSHLADSFNAMRISLKEEQAIRNRFLMGVSHDLRTPLTTIEGYIEAIKDGVIPLDQIDSVMDKLQNKSRLLESRILELIDYVKMQTGEWQLALEEVPLKSVLTDLDEVYTDELTIAGRNFSMVLDLSSNLKLKMDTALFVRMLENLINNAIKYSSVDSEIKMISQYHGGDLTFSVINSGEVIPIPIQNLVFEPFFRASPSRNAPGFGLGLSIVKSIVDAHQWRLELISTGEEGTIFKVIVPAELISKIK